jgi:hypothetical protein
VRRAIPAQYLQWEAALATWPAVKARGVFDVFFRLLRGGVARGAETLQVACVPKEFSVPAMRDDMIRNGGMAHPARRLTVTTKRMLLELPLADASPARRVVARVTQTALTAACGGSRRYASIQMSCRSGRICRTSSLPGLLWPANDQYTAFSV